MGSGSSRVSGYSDGFACYAEQPEFMDNVDAYGQSVGFRPEENRRNALEFNEPPYCECARTGDRPLSWLTRLPFFSDNSVLDYFNKEVGHEHIQFTASGDNIGFGPHGLFSEDVTSYDYNWAPECYDGSTMRKAIAETEPREPYLFAWNNCQSYVEDVLKTYEKLK